MNSDLPKYKEIAQVLRTEFMENGAVDGTYLPPEVTLAEKYHVTRGTIRRAMAFLEKDGLVTPVISKRRQFLRAEANGNPVIIGCLAAGRPGRDEFANIGYMELFGQLAYEFQKKNIILARILVHPDALSDMPVSAYSDQIKCYLSLGNVDISCISDIEKSIIAIDPPYNLTGKYYIIRPDGKSAGINAVHYLYSKGHKKIAFLNTETKPPYPFFDDLCTGFKRGLELCGLEKDQNVFNISYEERNNYELCEKFFKNNAYTLSRKDALVLCTSNFAVNVLRALINIGIAVPDQLSVLAVGGAIDSKTCIPPLTVYKNDFDKYSKYICEHVINIMYRKTTILSENQFNVCTLVEGGTVMHRLNRSRRIPKHEKPV